MCVIIERNPGFKIPEDKLESAIITNPDGWGLCFPSGNGELQTARSALAPEVELLDSVLHEQLRNEKIMLHLRYNTAGATNLRNAHPFPVMERGPDGVDIRMAHNGTIHSYKPSKDDTSSDTRLFVRDFVRPLFKRMAKVIEVEEVLADPLIKTILEGMIPSSSVLSFMDGYGNTLTINETGNGGKREEEWYYSNKYSFNRTHRTGVTQGNFTQGTSTGYGNGTLSQNGGTQTTVTTTSQATSTTPLFTEEYGINQEDLLHLDDTSIKQLTIAKKDDAQLLIKELLYIYKTLLTENTKLGKTVIALKGKLND